MMKKTTRKGTKRSIENIETEMAILDLSSSESLCNHCGGRLRNLPGEISCLSCGRANDHHCPDCLNDSTTAVV
ncbi:MAG TPA: hypothetical protein QF720_01145 [Nitrospinota bacterium]|jgi:predicted amidophosphoribosyltransferase|nr:hypothetical protein [Nitrospinota bacterium]|tara:strand:+ start:11961 stop:12179 length:219 start_codon:yes stop_codon:yes gene_type:complete